MVTVEPPKVSGIQPIGVLGELVMAYLRIPPYLSDVGTGADEEGVAVAVDDVGLAEEVAGTAVAEVGA
jgi:hypothetical protein